MEAYGVHNPKSTDETRVRDRNRAEALGNIWNIFTSQPFLIGYVVLAFILAGIVESVYIP